MPIKLSTRINSDRQKQSPKMSIWRSMIRNDYLIYSMEKLQKRETLEQKSAKRSSPQQKDQSKDNRFTLRKIIKKSEQQSSVDEQVQSQSEQTEQLEYHSNHQVDQLTGNKSDSKQLNSQPQTPSPIKTNSEQEPLKDEADKQSDSIQQNDQIPFDNRNSLSSSKNSNPQSQKQSSNICFDDDELKTSQHNLALNQLAQKQKHNQDEQHNKGEQKTPYLKQKAISFLSSIKLKPSTRKIIQCVAISDNHGDYKAMNQLLSLSGDIFIHAGDFTYQGRDQDFDNFFAFLDKLKFRHKIVISGNHENILSELKLRTVTTFSREKILSQLTKRCIYLQHEAIELEGIKIFASPYTPEYCQKPTSRAFQYKSSQDSIIWSTIPQATQLLITHGPPYGILDSGKAGKKAGSQALKQIVQKINPQYHLFGHIHESKGGMTKIQNTTYINLCNSPTRFIIQRVSDDSL